MVTEARLEIWKPIPGYEGLYEISNNGRVKVLERVVLSRCPRKRKERILGFGSRGKYRSVGLTKDGVRKHHAVHRLVTLAFVGEPPTPFHQPNHKDGDPGNNRDDNLEWMTFSENIVHSYRVLGRVNSFERRMQVPRGQYHKKAKLTDELVLEIKIASQAGQTIKSLAERHGVNISTIQRAIRAATYGYKLPSWKSGIGFIQ
jgi:hypothetical protein